MRRILVNGPGHTGLQPDETVTVLIPNEKQDITVDGVPLARDVVYMGLDPKDMPRVNVNLPAAPPNPPDPNAVSWPPNATITTQLQSDGTVLVS
ncbi:MAG: hypothetical protein JO235_17690 [Chroococcidiopsidaceae cyanobacterium CP_BM_RX_35]|nr:hypothetical protein [Chroococcidiopsidaceae cyanobacterium CP_BM_RX_35]